MIIVILLIVIILQLVYDLYGLTDHQATRMVYYKYKGIFNGVNWDSSGGTSTNKLK